MAARFEWNQSMISGEEITEILIRQYGPNQPISVKLDNLKKKVEYKSCIIPVHCNRCSSNFSMSPEQILASQYNRGYVCPNCGDKTESQIKEQFKQSLLDANTEMLVKEGVDLVANLDEQEDIGFTEEDLKNVEQDILKISKENVESKESTNAIESEKEVSKTIKVNNEIVDTISDSKEDTSFDDTLDDNFDEEDYSQPDDIDDTIQTDDDDETDLDIVTDDYLFDELDTDTIADHISDNQSIDDEIEEIVDDSDEVFEEEPEEEIEETISFDNKVLTLTEFDNKMYDTLKSIESKLGYTPFSEQYVLDRIKGTVELKCLNCADTFKITSFKALTDNIRFLDNAFCLKTGLTYKGVSEYIHPCPKCSSSIMTLGYNKYVKTFIEKVCRESNLNIVKPESYFYISLKSKIKIEANGIVKTLPISNIFDKYSGKDATKLEEFKPRGDATKSSTVIGDKRADVKIRHVTPKTIFTTNPADQYFSKAKDTSSKLEEEREREQSAVEESKIFRVTQKPYHNNNIAKLNSAINPFERSKKLNESFERSIFYNFLCQVSKDSKTKFNIIINSKTYEIPVVDFETGLRIICIDLKDQTLSQIPYATIADSAFSFKTNGSETKFKYVVLYSDSILYREAATHYSLVKNINPKVLAYGGKSIVLGNIQSENGLQQLQYTDNQIHLREFDTNYSTYPRGKPKTGQLGIVTQWNDTSVTMNSISSLVSAASSNGMSKLGDLEQYVCCSIRYIERFNKETNKVIYTITEYTEIGECVLADGLTQCLRALLKEYKIKYPQLSISEPHIVLELDPNTIFSPAIIEYIDNETLIPMDMYYKTRIEGNGSCLSNYNGRVPVQQYLRYSYIKRPEYRTKDEDYMRSDMRLFEVGTIVRLMAEEIKKAGIQNGIRDDNTRLNFIANMGYVKCSQIEVKEFFVNQSIVTSILMDSRTVSMQKLYTPESVGNNSGMLNNSTENNNMMNLINNPRLMNKYISILQNGSPEAVAYLNNNILGSSVNRDIYNMQQQPMMGMGMQQPMMGMQQPMMGMGMQQPMMGMGMQQPMMGMGMQQPMMGMGMQQPMMGMGMQQPMMGMGMQQPMMGMGMQQPMMGMGMQQPIIK